MQSDAIAMETTGPDRGPVPRGGYAGTRPSGGETFAEIMADGATTATPAKRIEKADGAPAVGGEAPAKDKPDATETPASGDPATVFVIGPPLTPSLTAETAPPVFAADAVAGTGSVPAVNPPPPVANGATSLAAAGGNASAQPGAGDGGATPTPPPSFGAIGATSDAETATPLPSPAAKPAVPPAIAPAAAASTAAVAPAAAQPVVAGPARAATSAIPEPPSAAAADSADFADLLKTAVSGATQTREPQGAAAAKKSGSDRGGNSHGGAAPAAPPSAAAPPPPTPGGAGAKNQPAEMTAAEPDASPAAASPPAHAPSGIAPPAPPLSTQAAAPVAPAAASAAPPPPAAEQVSVHIAKAVKAGLDRIDIQLSPASLGRIEIRLDISDKHHVNATLAADSRDTLDMLKSDVRLLERVLQDAGLKTDSGSLSFHLRDQGARPGHDGDTRRAARSSRGTGAEDIETLRPAALATAMSAVTPGGIDIHA